MFSVEKTPSSIAFRFSSEIHLVEEVLQKFEKYCHRLNVKEPSSLIVVLQELLKNAVIHGNRKDTNKNVVCTLISWMSVDLGLRWKIRDQDLITGILI